MISEKDIIRPSTSPWVLHCFFIRKKDDNKMRLVVDYRQLNELTRKIGTDHRNIEDVLEHLGQSCNVPTKFHK